MRSTPISKPRLLIPMALGLTVLAAPAWAAPLRTCYKDQPDGELTAQVRHELLVVSDADSSEGIQVRARNGVVTLSGAVSNLQVHQNALWAARAVRNVRAVIDLIQVRPAFRSNADLTRGG